MNLVISGDGRSLRRFVVAAVVVLLIIAGAIAVGQSQPEPTAVPPEGPTADALPPNRSEGETAAERHAPPSDAAEAMTFARETAVLLFTWDSLDGPDSAPIRGSIAALADPTGEETPGLLADLDNYLPDETTWRHLGALGARQRITVETASVPGAWADAVGLEPELAGTYAVNVVGTRHREATITAFADRSDSPVRFTAFVRCPASEQCSLLRLGCLGETWKG